MDSKRKRKHSPVPNPKEIKQEETVDLRYGPMPTFPNQKRFTRHIIVISMIVIVYFYSMKEKERVFASSDKMWPQRTMSFTCSTMLSKEVSQFLGCVPQTCGRGVYDQLVADREVEALLKLAEKGFAHSKPDGGAAILDLHSGALSHHENFINIYKVANVGSFLDPEAFSVYKEVRTKLQHTIAAQFMVDPANLHLTHPTFFSRLTAAPPRTIHDEYWHQHVDKETYQSFHYTALLYLSDHGTDFDGGRFIFMEADNTSWVVEPIRGRVLIFTSGAENTHRVERVTSGIRTALTIAFTCDASLAVEDPALPAMKPLT